MKTEEFRELDAWIAVNLFGWEWLARYTRSNSESDTEFARRAIFPPVSDEWIRFNYIGAQWWPANMSEPLFSDWDRCCVERDDDNINGQFRKYGLPKYSTDPAAAMDVLKKCLTSQMELGFGDPMISKDGNNYWIRTNGKNGHIEGEGETLELAIAKFAKQLYSK